jgi:hypothetical protein
MSSLSSRGSETRARYTGLLEEVRLVYTGLVVELEYLKIETRLIDEMFASVMGEYVFLK